jgi:hypothetical protein
MGESLANKIMNMAKISHVTKIVPILLLALLNSVIAAGENKVLIKNGNFDNGLVGWTGRAKTEEIDGNKVAVVEAGPSQRLLSQKVRVRSAKRANLQFRYQFSEDFKGKGFQVRMMRDEGDDGENWTYYDVKADAKSKGKWKNFKGHLTGFDMSSDNTFEILVYSGSGKVLFDDFNLDPEGK